MKNNNTECFINILCMEEGRNDDKKDKRIERKKIKEIEREK